MQNCVRFPTAKAIGKTDGLYFVKKIAIFFVFCGSSIIIGTFQGEVRKINNADAIVDEIIGTNAHFFEMQGGEINHTELVAALIDQKENFVEGIRYAQDVIDGSMWAFRRISCAPTAGTARNNP